MKVFALCLLVITLVQAAQGQGTIQFVNIDFAAGVNAPVFQSDGVTKLSGSQFTAELFVGTDAVNLASVATTGFLTGSGAGYFNGGTQTVPTISPGATAFVQVGVWNTMFGSTFVQAKTSGMPNSWWASSIFSVGLGGGIINPIEPAALTGLGNSPVYLNSVPEPSALALLGCGLVVGLMKKGLTN